MSTSGTSLALTLRKLNRPRSVRVAVPFAAYECMLRLDGSLCELVTCIHSVTMYV